MSEPELGIDELIRRIRDEAARSPSKQDARTASPSDLPFSGASVKAGFKLPRWSTPSASLAGQDRDDVSSFLAYEDEEFVRNAYHGILGRSADSDGLKHFLSHLRSGKWTKVDVLGRLRYSKEGRARATPVAGLRRAFIFHSVTRVPVLGGIAAWMYHVVRLPHSIGNLQRRVDACESRNRGAIRQGNALAEATEHSLRSLEHSIAAAARDIAEKADEASLSNLRTDVETRLSGMRAELFDVLGQRLSLAEDGLSRLEALAGVAAQQRHDQRFGNIEQTLARIDQRLAEELSSQHVGHIVERLDVISTLREQTATLRNDMELARRRINELRPARVPLAPAASGSSTHDPRPVEPGAAPSPVPDDEHMLDAFYVSFEDQFRGSREDIKARVTCYLDTVRNAGAGTVEAPIVDVGCGRGEWIELLRDEGLSATGIDVNGVMVSECRERGLNVEHSDLFAYLARCPGGSLGALTGFHIIEHLPFRRVVELLDETLRVLRPGGVAIFETPNPENLTVAAGTFYNDPTHLNPLPPELMRFSMHARGFSGVHVLRLRPVTVPNGNPDPVVQIVRDLLSAARDYAVVGTNG